MPNADTEPISCGTARSLFDLRLSHQLSSEYTILGLDWVMKVWI